MKTQKGEQGYALLVVLLLVVLIMALSAVFMRGAISNAKQEKRVDVNHLSVVAAEMGVEYYTTLYTNEFISVRDDKWKEARKAVLIEHDNLIKNKQQGLTPEQVFAKTTIEAANAIKNHLSDIELANNYPADAHFNPPVKQDNPEELGFDIAFVNGRENNYDILIAGHIVGHYSDGKDSKLKLNLTFLMPNLNENNPTQDNNDLGDSVIDPENWFTNAPVEIIDKPEATCPNQTSKGECYGTKFGDITSDNNIIYFDQEIGKNNQGNIGQNFKGLKIYTTSDLKFGNMNNTENLNVFAKGDVSFKNGASGYSSSVIISDKKLTAEQVNFKKVKVQVNDFVTTKKFEIENSVVFVIKDFTGEGNKFTLEKNSKMCVGGKVNVKANVEIRDQSLLFILEDNNHLKEKNGNYKSGVVKVDTLEDLQKACHAGGSDNNDNIDDIESGTIKWDKPVIDVIY